MTDLIRRKLTAFPLAALGAGLLSRAAWASDYPNRVVRLVVPFGPGGATDLVARVLSNRLSTTLGQQVIVENRSGAGGIVGQMNVRESAPDGYSLLMATIGFGANPALYRFRKLPFDPTKDFTPIVKLVDVPTALVVSPKLGVRTAAELIEMARAKPDSLNYGSAGYGTINHLAGELLKAETGIKMVHVPYKSGGASVQAAVTGEISALFATVPSSINFIKGGQLVPIAVSIKDRIALLPDVPPLAETVPGFNVAEWQGIVGPAGMPGDIVAKLNSEVVAALKDPGVAKRLADMGAQPVGSTPAQFDAFIKAEVQRWFKVAEATGMKAEE